MTIEEARRVLNVSTHDEEEVVDAFNTKTFEIRNFIFRTTLIPLLAKKRAEQLLKLQAAFDVLLPKEREAIVSVAFESQKEEYKLEFNGFTCDLIQVMSVSDSLELLNVNEGATPVELIQSYEKKMANDKFLFSSTYEADWMAFFLSRMVATDLAFQTILDNDLYSTVEQVIQHEPELVNQEVKNAEGILSSEVLKVFDLLEWTDKPLSKFTFKQLQEKLEKIENKKELKPLFTEVLRCHKSLQIKL